MHDHVIVIYSAGILQHLHIVLDQALPLAFENAWHDPAVHVDGQLTVDGMRSPTRIAPLKGSCETGVSFTRVSRAGRAERSAAGSADMAAG